MRSVQILEDHDEIRPDDWVRPLRIVDSDHCEGVRVETFSAYGGSPTNNVRWIKVRDYFGECHWGKKLGEIHELFSHSVNWQNAQLRFEVVRGEMPNAHVWDWRKTKKGRGL